MQRAQHAANNFQIFVMRIVYKTKAFSIKNATKARFLGNFLSISWQKNRDIDKFSSNRLIG